MSEDPPKQRLGRGLAALIGEIDKPAPVAEKRTTTDGKVPIEFISPNPRNPRRSFSDADLTDLAQSIRAHGIVQPLSSARLHQCRIDMKSSLANAAGGPRKKLVSSKFPSSFGRLTTERRWSWRLSKMSSGPTSIRRGSAGIPTAHR